MILLQLHPNFEFQLKHRQNNENNKVAVITVMMITTYGNSSLEILNAV